MKHTALITGASSGIGKELAEIHAEKGGDLILVARSKDKLEQIKQDLESKYNIKVILIIKDLTDVNAPQEIFDEVKGEKIEIDYLINNAGFGGQGYFHERNWQDDKNMIQLNVMALTELTRLFLPDFVKRNSGKILNVSSTASFMPGPLQAVYFATKSYVQFFSNALSEELSNTNVSVTNLMPGATETKFAKVSNMDKTGLFDKTASVRSVAEDGYNAMLDGKMDIISGLTFGQKIMFYLIPFTPKKVLLKQIKNMQEIKK
ncbi:MAG: SDR family oxidoreductase [Candidatus Gracilibacteria bacterium]|nr:SDR family oxidoreductase [Candidatus Gracilibacteria bacterium]